MDKRDISKGKKIRTLTPVHPNAKRRWWGSILSLWIGLSALSCPAQIVINEIMYHPNEPWPSTQPNPTTNRTEFVEIYNAGDVNVDLTRYKFTSGINFAFPEGTLLAAHSYLVICQDLSTFTNHYVGVTNCLGNFSGTLANGGERVTLSYSWSNIWVIEDSVVYLDGGPADGDGYSLEQVNPAFAPLTNQYDGVWLPSTELKGTPGRRNSVYTAIPAPAVGNVSQDPALPFPGSIVTVRCHAFSTTGTETIKLRYRKSTWPESSWSEIPMLDDGIGSDAMAGDGLYAVQFPPTNRSAMADGDLLEFRIVATDSNGSRTIPSVNRSGVTGNGPFSFLCYFGNDTAYNGEYPTYHILMTESNRTSSNGLEVRNLRSDDLLDCTFVTSSGEVFYNCGIRLRGNNSREPTRGNYRISFPPGRALDGFTAINFNHVQALRQYVGMRICEKAGLPYSPVKLSRIWLNHIHKSPLTSNGIYVRLLGAMTDEYLEYNKLPPTGNTYRGGLGANKTGDLRWLPNGDYWNFAYRLQTNNPYNGWNDLNGLCWALAQDASQLPTILSNRVNVSEWGRLFGAVFAMENGEGGLLCPTSTYGDDYGLYIDPSGVSYMLPWDFDTLFDSQTSLSIWSGFSGLQHLQRALINPPILPYYIGDIYDIIVNVMSDQNMNSIFDEMGSILTVQPNTNFRSTVSASIRAKRANIISQVYTNLNVTSISGKTPGALLTLTPASNVMIPTPVNGINQQANTPRWILLASIPVSDPSLVQVKVTHNTTNTQATVADAIMFSNATAQIIVDNTSPGVTFTGTWGTDSLASHYGGTLHWSKTLSSTATWPATLPAAGQYSIYAFADATKVGRDYRNSSANYTILTRRNSISIDVSGNAPQPYTAKVVVNGNEATWNLRNHTWSTPSPIVLASDFTNIVVQALDPKGRELALITCPVAAGRNPTVKTGTLSSSTVWSGNSSIFVVSNTVTISSGATLTISSNATVAFAPGGTININNGTLNIQGSADAPVRLIPYDGASTWTVHAEGASASLSLDSVECVGGMVSARNARSVTLKKCVVRDYTEVNFNNTPTLIEDTLLTRFSNRGLDLKETLNAVIRRCTIEASTLPNATGIRVSQGCSALITNCMISGVSGPGLLIPDLESSVDMDDCVIHHASTGIVVTASDNCDVQNVTITDCPVGLSGNATLSDCLVWNLGTPIGSGSPVITYSDVQGASGVLYPGVGNINRNPWFQDSANADYRLLSFSTSLNAGKNGDLQGAHVPVGAAPAPPSNLSILSASATSLRLGWSDNSADEQRFELERTTTGSVWQRIAVLPRNTTTYTDTGLLQNFSYSYRVRASHSRGNSLYSKTCTAVTPYAASTVAITNSLRITEIMYQHSGWGGSNGDLFEFIEFKNISTSNTLDLSGLALNQTMFIFPNGTHLAPGRFFVLIRNPAFFDRRYPTTSHQGTFMTETGLNNNHDTLELTDPASNVVLKAEYFTDWYPTTAGVGYSLVTADPNPLSAKLTQMQDWRSSSKPGGSPGADDPTPSYSTVVINEILTHTDASPFGDAIELFNAGARTVDIGGWYLTDDAGNLRNYQIPKNTTIESNGYIVLTQLNHFNNAFALSELGEVLILSSASNLVLTSYRTSVTFGASDREVTFGRYTRSDGKVDFVPMRNPTPNIANSPPRIGPVVINEIMYNPPASGKEYVELLNITANPVPLYNPATSSSWQLAEGIAYSFPSNAIIGPKEHILVTGIDPVEFRLAQGITNPAVKIFGPFTGSLANGGEAVTLNRPGDIEANGFVPMLLTDRIEYSPLPPWPVSADNLGTSLERKSPSSYGNDPINWISKTLGGTPGGLNNTQGLASVSFGIPAITVMESNQVVTLPVVLSPPITNGSVTVKYSVIGGSATDGLDYTFTSGSLTFWPLDTTNMVSVTILNDTETGESNETIRVALNSPSGNARLGGYWVSTCIITDDDRIILPAPTISPDGGKFFKSTEITMSSPTPGAEIRYTIDGRIPTRTDPPFLGTPVSLLSSARVKAKAFLGSLHESSVASSLFTQQAFSDTNGAPPCCDEDPIVANAAIYTAESGADDAEEGASGAVNLTGKTLALGSFRLIKVAGLRFPHIAIPKGMIVTNAYVQFTSSSNASVAATVTLRAEAADNSPAFSTAQANLTARPLTTAAVTWGIPAWNNLESRPAQKTPNLAALVQEVMSRSGWASSNALTILIYYNVQASTRFAWTYECGNTNYVPRLVLEYGPRPPPTVPFTVLSMYGSALPPAGINQVPIGPAVSRIQNSPLLAGGGKLYRCIGWTGTGDVPATGAGDSTGEFLLANSSSIEWLWRTEYYVEIEAGPYGTVDKETSWYPAATTLVVRAIPTFTSRFIGWIGTIQSSENPVTIRSEQGLSILAIFTNVGYRISASASSYGTIQPSGDLLVPDGRGTNFLITAMPGAVIRNVLVDGVNVGAVNQYSFSNVRANHTIQASFDMLTTPHGVPIAWMQRHKFTNNYVTEELLDQDSDLARTWEEHRAGTDPTNPASVLRMLHAEKQQSGVRLRWLSAPNHRYSLYRGLQPTDLKTALPIKTNASADISGTNEYIDPAPPAAAGFYRIEVRTNSP